MTDAGKLAEAPDEGVRVLVIEVGTERRALPLADVREVVAAATVTEVPRAPEVVVGVISVRGAITTVVDAGRLLGVEGAAPPSAPVVLVEADGEIVGLRVGRVVRVAHDGPESASLPQIIEIKEILSAALSRSGR